MTKLAILLAILLCGCAAHKPVATAQTQFRTEIVNKNELIIFCQMGVQAWYERGNMCHANESERLLWPNPAPAPRTTEWACHAGDTYAEPTPVGIFLWRYTRLQRVFGVKCERQGKPVVPERYVPYPPSHKCDDGYEWNQARGECVQK